MFLFSAENNDNSTFTAEFVIHSDQTVTLKNADRIFLQLYHISFADIGKNMEEFFPHHECLQIYDLIRRYSGYPFTFMRLLEVPGMESLWELQVTVRDDCIRCVGRRRNGYGAEKFAGYGTIDFNQDGKAYFSEINTCLAEMLCERDITIALIETTSHFQCCMQKKMASCGYVDIPDKNGVLRQYFMDAVPVAQEEQIVRIHFFLLPAGVQNRTDSLLLDRLTPKECCVMRLSTLGISTAEIDRRLYIAEGTVKKELYSGFSKLGVRNKLEAAIVLYHI